MELAQELLVNIEAAKAIYDKNLYLKRASFSREEENW